MKPRPGNTTNGRKNNTSRLDWDINTCSTQLNYRSDWDIDTIRKNSGRPDWDIDTSHANTPHSTLLRHSHTLAGLHLSAYPAAPKPARPPLATFFFFHFHFFEREAKERRGTNSLSQLSDECRTTTPENTRCHLQEGHDAGSAVDNDPRRVGFSSAFSKDGEG